MRLFVALEMPLAVRDKVEAVCAELQLRWPDMRWVASGNFHVTLKFIGAASAEELELFREALGSVRMSSPLRLRCAGLGLFSGRDSSRALFAKIDQSPPLRELAAEIDKCIQHAKPIGENRSFVPHVTLARSKSGNGRGQMEQILNSYNNFEFGVWSANEFTLFESKLNPAGPEYTGLQSFCFATETPA